MDRAMMSSRLTFARLPEMFSTSRCCSSVGISRYSAPAWAKSSSSVCRAFGVETDTPIVLVAVRRAGILAELRSVKRAVDLLVLWEQLADGGRLVIPVGDTGYQDLTPITRAGDDFCERVVCGCSFVKLIGAEGWSP